MSRSNRARSLAAFTMIELMVAIGILIILVGILMFAMKSIGDRAKAAETRTALENARGLLAELESKAKLGQSNAPAQWWAATSAGNASLFNITDLAVVADSDIDFWHMTNKVTSPTVHPVTIDAPPSVKEGEPARDTDYAIRNTVIAMTKLITIPANRTKFQGIPANRLYKPKFNPPGPRGPNDDALTANVDESQAPVLLDGWGNPILFVPAAGMVNVKLSGITGDPKFTLITSSKVRRTDDPNTSQAWANISVDRPFFASAGPDGDFSTGDDNIYSFEQ